ncbi:MAG: SDR family NAD(P)-dependent oxidoreductase [Acidobacteria bacterium]|nr:SDR family NAD(P)-dependent oxidoreductase [Acidobacteriota bacterium]
METSGNTVLITGGATGIGFALAEALANRGNDVVICGRRLEKLRAAKKRFPAVHVRVCDVSTRASRQSLVNWAMLPLPVAEPAGQQRGYPADHRFPKRGPRSAAGRRGTCDESGSSDSPERIAHPAPQETAALGDHALSLSLRHQLRDTTVRGHLPSSQRNSPDGEIGLMRTGLR